MHEEDFEPIRDDARIRYIPTDQRVLIFMNKTFGEKIQFTVRYPSPPLPLTVLAL